MSDPCANDPCANNPCDPIGSHFSAEECSKCVACQLSKVFPGLTGPIEGIIDPPFPNVISFVTAAVQAPQDEDLLAKLKAAARVCHRCNVAPALIIFFADCMKIVAEPLDLFTLSEAYSYQARSYDAIGDSIKAEAAYCTARNLAIAHGRVSNA